MANSGGLEALGDTCINKWPNNNCTSLGAYGSAACIEFCYALDIDNSGSPQYIVNHDLDPDSGSIENLLFGAHGGVNDASIASPYRVRTKQPSLTVNVSANIPIFIFLYNSIR